MRRGAAVELVLQRLRQVVVGGVHVAELRLAERLAVAQRHVLRMQDVGQRNVVAVRHVGVPALAGIVGSRSACPCASFMLDRIITSGRSGA